MQPGLRVTTNTNLSGGAMDVSMYFTPIFEGFRQHFFFLVSECVAFFTIRDSLFFPITFFKCAFILQRYSLCADQPEETRSLTLAGF